MAQNNIVHIKMWHTHFWFMVIADMLTAMAVCMFIPLLPVLPLPAPLSCAQVGQIAGAFGLGLFSLGAFSSYLVQRYRRNHVCIWSVLFMAVLLVLAYYALSEELPFSVPFPAVLGGAFMYGAFYGLAQMVLVCTLIIDTCESYQRTDANYVSSWFSRLALPLGAVAALLASNYFGVYSVFFASVACCVLAVFMIGRVRFPFKAPEDNVLLVSLDRFFLPQGFPLFLNLVFVSCATGMMLSTWHDITDYVMIMPGFCIALLLRRYFFQTTQLAVDAPLGMVLLGVAICLYLLPGVVSPIVVPFLVGCGIGLIGARFLLLFINLSHHCQRGTSQSTFFLSWEGGIALGLYLGYAVLGADMLSVTFGSLASVVVAVAMYLLFTRSWYAHHKGR